jgi:hypothetical protein
MWLSADCETPSLAAARVKLRARHRHEDHQLIEAAALHLSIRLMSACRS